MIIDFDIAKTDEYDDEYLIRVLQASDDAYYNDGAPFITDAVYDALRLVAVARIPHHKYFTGIGSDVRTGKIKLPYPMGSLDQVEIGEITDWVGDWSLQDQFVIITDKLDGTSAMVIYDDNGDLQIAYSRGNGVEGADITRHIKHLVPANIGRPAVIRGEVIIPKHHFESARDVAKSRSGSEYRNARNMVAGLMNAKFNPEEVYAFIHFVAYDILGFEGIDKVNMLRDLENMKFNIPGFTSKLGYELTDVYLASYLDHRRSATDYEIDGVVIDVNLATKRNQMNPTRNTLNPAFSVKYKVADASNLAHAEVIGVEWNVSKHGYLKPRIKIKPVELVGVTVQHCTGFNAKFIQDNGIGEGSVIEVTRSGDVVPFCKSVIKPTTADMPDVPYTWNESGVDAILDNHHNNDDVIINRIVDFFASIEAPYLKKGNVTSLYEYRAKGFTEDEIIQMSEQMLISILGKNGKKVYAGLRKALTNIPLWKLMGSTHFFGRGVGRRKMKKLLDALGHEVVFTGKAADFADAEGFDEKTARKIEDGMSDFLAWLSPLEEFGYITVDYDSPVDNTGKLTGEKIVFTGFRDASLQALAEANGATMQSSVSGKTTILVAVNPASNSSKMQKARDAGVRIMGIDEFKELL
jgi:DNA ligase (NAD+)